MTADPVRTLRDAVNAAIGEDQGFRGAIGVACSGGADSMALADAAIAEAGADRVVVVTVDHQLSPGSAAVADGVATWARGQGARAVAVAVRVQARASVEAAARDARYAALDDAADAHDLAAILLGHTERDQAETVLMRILRGTGPAGLAGIPARRGVYVRPLLALPRAVTEAYVAARGLPTWADPMNADLRVTRVRAREHLLPLLRAENPAIDDALLRLAAASREWLDAIDQLSEPFAGFPIACSMLAAQPAAIRKRALARALERAGIDYEATHLDDLDALVRAPSRGEVALDLPAAKLVRTYDVLAPSTAAAAAAAAANTSELPPAPPGHHYRVWQPGDRMRPARLGGHSRKLSDLFGDAKVPRQLRGSARVLVRDADRAIVWAEHLGDLPFHP